MNAPVTIVEFFDPSCEACRAFYPLVKQVMDRYPGKVRLVIRYAAFHQGSDEAVRILEAARKQNLFEPVLEALLAGQPTWASHSSPNLQAAWMMAASAGLDMTRAQQDAPGEDVTAVLEQDAADVATFNVRATPTFFIAGEELTDFGPQQFADAVQAAVEATD
jgi:protein-disulfide isomerase